jgi:serine/threonine protein phosphatase 1
MTWRGDIMASRVIAIGDIHGTFRALDAVLRSIQPTADDTLVVLGDCVDRGPGSREVIDTLLRLRAQCRLITLLGNHEEMMLDHLAGRKPRFDWLPFGGAATMQSYEQADPGGQIDSSHLDYVRTWGDYFEHGSYFFAHGAYDYRLPLGDQDWNRWRWHSLRTYVPPPHESGKIAVVGHTALKDGMVLDMGHLICIDTYCWGGGWLTALDVTTGQLWQANRDGRMNPEITHRLLRAS